jgi:hypothetical protein
LLSEQDKFVRSWSCLNPLVDTLCEGFKLAASLRCLNLQLLHGYATEPDAAGKLVDRESFHTEPFSEASRGGSRERHKLEATVLSLTVAYGEPGVLIRLSLNVRNAIRVATDGNALVYALDRRLTRVLGKALAQ